VPCLEDQGRAHYFVSMAQFSKSARKRLLPAAIVAALAGGPALAQNVGTTGNIPGGITLVPGTIVTPDVGGSAGTGRVPLAGLPGSPGVPNYDPQLGPRRAPDAGGQYQVAPYPPIMPPLTNQSAVPQNLQPGPGQITPGANTAPFGPPSLQFCPNGAVTGNGLC